MSFHCFAELPKSYVLSAFGIKLEVKSALILIESLSASPIVISPPIVKSPVTLPSPSICNAEPLIVLKDQAQFRLASNG